MISQWECCSVAEQQESHSTHAKHLCTSVSGHNPDSNDVSRCYAVHDPRVVRSYQRGHCEAVVYIPVTESQVVGLGNCKCRTAMEVPVARLSDALYPIGMSMASNNLSERSLLKDVHTAHSSHAMTPGQVSLDWDLSKNNVILCIRVMTFEGPYIYGKGSRFVKSSWGYLCLEWRIPYRYGRPEKGDSQAETSTGLTCGSFAY